MGSSENKIKIALMTYAMDNRSAKGSSLYARKIVEGLVSDGSFEVFLVHFDSVDDPLYKKANEILIKKIKLPFAARFFSLMWFFWTYRFKQFDIIQWFQPRMYPFFWFAPAKKIIVTAHGGGDKAIKGKFFLSKWVFNLVLTYFHRYIDVIIAGSEFGRKEISQHYRVPLSKIKVTYYGGGDVYNPLDRKQSFDEVTKKYSIPGPFILNISRLQPHKNVGSLIEAYNIFRDNHANKFYLVIVARPHDGYDKTYDLARSSKYSEDIIFIDFIPEVDMNKFYSAATIFVFPSLNEGFGLPVLEAMAAGTPVVTSNVTSLPEVAGDSAVIINPYNVDDIAEAINNLISDVDTYNTLRERGLKWAQGFTWARTVEETKKIYYDVMKTKA